MSLLSETSKPKNKLISYTVNFTLVSIFLHLCYQKFSKKCSCMYCQILDTQLDVLEALIKQCEEKDDSKDGRIFDHLKENNISA